MKKLYYAALAIASGALLFSCTKDPLTLSGTDWNVDYFEDLYSGSIINEGNTNGTMRAEDLGYGDIFMYFTVPEFGLSNEGYGSEDYHIVKYTDSELIVDIWFYEVDYISEYDCTYLETFNGRDVYLYLDTNDDVYYFYFNPNGWAVSLGLETGYGDYYFYDRTRLYCTRYY